MRFGNIGLARAAEPRVHTVDSPPLGEQFLQHRRASGQTRVDLGGIAQKYPGFAERQGFDRIEIERRIAERRSAERGSLGSRRLHHRLRSLAESEPVVSAGTAKRSCPKVASSPSS